MSIYIDPTYLDLARGAWQRNLVQHGGQLSTLSLEGKARNYSDRYRTSFNNLVDRCSEASAFVETGWGLNANRRWERWILVTTGVATVADLPGNYSLISDEPDMLSEHCWSTAGAPSDAGLWDEYQPITVEEVAA